MKRAELECCFYNSGSRDLRPYSDGCSETVYRLDRCETYNSMAASMSSLLRLMENSPVWFVALIDSLCVQNTLLNAP